MLLKISGRQRILIFFLAIALLMIAFIIAEPFRLVSAAGLGFVIVLGIFNNRFFNQLTQEKPLRSTEARSTESVDIFRQGLGKTRQSFMGRISQALGNTEITEETWEDLEAM